MLPGTTDKQRRPAQTDSLPRGITHSAHYYPGQLPTPGLPQRRKIHADGVQIGGQRGVGLIEVCSSITSNRRVAYETAQSRRSPGDVYTLAVAADDCENVAPRIRRPVQHICVRGGTGDQSPVVVMPCG
jgi:hypothetical protein